MAKKYEILLKSLWTPALLYNTDCTLEQVILVFYFSFRSYSFKHHHLFQRRTNQWLSCVLLMHVNMRTLHYYYVTLLLLCSQAPRVVQQLCLCGNAERCTWHPPKASASERHFTCEQFNQYLHWVLLLPMPWSCMSLWTQNDSLVLYVDSIPTDCGCPGWEQQQQQQPLRL